MEEEPLPLPVEEPLDVLLSFILPEPFLPFLPIFLPLVELSMEPLWSMVPVEPLPLVEPEVEDPEPVDPEPVDPEPVEPVPVEPVWANVRGNIAALMRSANTVFFIVILLGSYLLDPSWLSDRWESMSRKIHISLNLVDFIPVLPIKNNT